MPHGAGAYYNMFGKYISSNISGGPTYGEGSSYGEYVPGSALNLHGEILAGSINYQNNSLQNYNVYAASYSGFTNHNFGTALSLTNGSFDFSLAIGLGLPVIANDYIGIYVADPSGGSQTAPKLLIEGTLYYSLFS